MNDLSQNLRSLHEELARADRLDAEDRELLETLLADIHRLLDRTGTNDGAGAVDKGSDRGDALEGAAVRLEAGHPGLAGAIRSVLDALGKAGI